MTKNMDNTRKLLLLIILSGLIAGSSIISVNGTNNSSNGIRVAGGSDINAINPQDLLGPTIGTPTENPVAPSTDQSTTISSVITDVDGVDEARLFWEYNSNSTIFNDTMVTTTSPINKNDGDFTTDGWVNSSGQTVIDPTDWAYVLYEYSVQEIASLDITVSKGVPSSLVTYVRIEILNVSTGFWEQKFEVQGVDLSDPINTQNYSLDQLVLGVRIYAVTFWDGKDADPAKLLVNLTEVSYSTDILANNVPAFVSYYLVANDTNGLQTTSPTYNLFMDNAPTVTIWNLATGIKGNLVLNVSVFDADGVSTINDTSVIAYYRAVTDLEWQSTPLLHLFDDFSNNAFYNVSITLSGLDQAESDYEIVVNATDIVNGQNGITSSSGVNIISVDNLGPRISNLVFKPGSFVDNVTHFETDVDLTATFTDKSGIKNATLYYSDVNSATFNLLQMSNTSEIGLNIQTSNYDVIITSSNVSGSVDYYFETIDFLGNVKQSIMNQFTYDGDGPIILGELLIFEPRFISNVTDVTMLFNATDIAGVNEAVVWYTYNGTTWDSVVANLIEYANIELPRQVFDAFVDTDLPLLIKNGDVTIVNLEVKRILSPQDAILFLDITHDRSSDLRIWLNISNGKHLLIFDRENDVSLNNLEINLFELGLTVNDFDNYNFTIEIEDFNSLYSGFLSSYSIELIQYELPPGYQFSSVIPRSEQDTEVTVFVTLTDGLGNVVNSTEFTYYTDGLAPTVTLNALSGPVTLDEFFMEISAEANDGTGISDVELYYRFHDNESWSIIAMSSPDGSSTYTGKIPLPNLVGNVTYYVRVFDQVGLSATSNEQNTEYVVIPRSSGDADDDFVRIQQIAVAVAVIGGVAAIVALIVKGKIKIPNRLKLKKNN